MKRPMMVLKNQLVMKSLLSVLLIICFSTLRSWAQSGKLFNTDNQLSSNLATQVYQDTNGFIWITTRNGLNVYDGYNFSVLKKSNEDNNQLNTNYFNCIAQDQDGYILIGTNKGLLLYNGKQFANIPLPDDKGKAITTYVTHIKKLRDGNVIISTSGWGIFLMKRGEHVCHVIKGTDKALKYSSRITEDSKGRIWIITEDGKLYRMEKNAKFSTNFAGTEGLSIKDIQEDSKGNLYLATQKQGIYVKTVGSSVFTRISSIGNLPIQTIYISHNDNLYIGCDGEGILVYNPKTGMATSNPFFSSQINLQKSKVQNIIEDNQGNIWFSMLQKGVFMQPQSLNDFGYMGFRLGNRNIIGDNCVTSVFLDNEQNLWVGTDKDGLYKLSYNEHKLLAHYLPGETILTICQDKNDRMWVGTYTNGAGVIDASGNYHRIHVEGMGNFGVFDIKCDRQGNLWLATMGSGLVRIGMDGAPIIYKVKNRSDNDIHANGIPNDYIAKIALSNDQSHIYLATSIGLACLDLKQNSWTSALGGVNCLNRNSFSHCIFVDSKDRIWYGTEDGIYLYKWGG